MKLLVPRQGNRATNSVSRMEKHKTKCMILSVLSFDLIKQLNLEKYSFNELQAIQLETAAIWRVIQVSNC